MCLDSIQTERERIEIFFFFLRDLNVTTNGAALTCKGCFLVSVKSQVAAFCTN